MRRLRSRLLLLLTGAALPAIAGSAPPQFEARWQQGAVLVGRTDPGASVRFGDRRLSVDAQGRFVLGLAYDAPPAGELWVTPPGGAEQRHEYAVQARRYDVQKIEGLPPGMVEPPPAVQRRIEQDQRRVAAARAFDTPRADFAGRFVWPLAAEVTGVYGSSRILNGVPRQPHFGVDLAAPQGRPVRASAGGIVRLAHADLYYTGGTIILDHGHGLSTTYLHLSRLDVHEGQEVAGGQVIGRVGATGRATGPHLCWRANWFDVRLDPSLLVGDEPAKKGERKT